MALTKHLSPRHDPNGSYVSATATPWGGSVHLTPSELTLREALLRNPGMTMAEARQVSGLTEGQLRVALDRLAQQLAPYKESEDTIEPTQCATLGVERPGLPHQEQRRRLATNTDLNVPFDGDEAGLDDPEDYEAA